jgi:polysaccharide biosynthesis/export protein
MKPFFYLTALLLLIGCASNEVPNTPRNTAVFQKAMKSDTQEFLDKDALAEFENGADTVYHLGEGDKITLNIWNRPELSGEHTLGPDGRITVPLIGSMKLATMTSEEASGKISASLRRYYTKPIVDIGVNEYKANRITLLGRVLTPGVLQFDSPPMLLDALARGGSLPVLDKQATLTRCAIFRGREKIIWVDLKRLLNRGDLAYNIRLKPNDVIYIPDSFDTMTYVLGAVQKPGAYRLTPDMSVLDALAQAGGPNEDGVTEEIAIYRPSKQAVEKFDMASLLTANRNVNFALEEGDIVYVPKKGIANVGYVLKQLLPGLSFMTFAQSMAMLNQNR